MNTYRFKDVLAIVAALNPDQQESTVASRIKQWQKMGLPCLPNSGRGTKGEYTRPMIWDIALLNALQRIGVPPLNGWKLLSKHFDGAAIRLPDGVITFNQKAIADAIVAQLGNS
jgi:hypothetical protein